MNNLIDRLHIGIFGPRNAGKSSLLNALTGQDIAIVSPVAGTTTDPVVKNMEINGLGATALIDTAGYDDYGSVGAMRVTKTKQTLSKCDIALFVVPDTLFSDAAATDEALRWFKMIESLVPDTLPVVNCFTEKKPDKERLARLFGSAVTEVNALTRDGMEELRGTIVRTRESRSDGSALTIVSHLVQPEDVVLLVMPQDLQAPRGRLILPQVQTIRELLDSRCVTVSCTTATLPAALASLAAPPRLIVTDSQAFRTVYEQKPEGSLLTSFSVLFARIKGDIDTFVSGAAAIESLNADSRVLIAEACTHAPLAEDIGREKIPALLRKRFGEIRIDIVSGNDFPDDLTPYSLIIHCGACMFNRRHVLSRIAAAQAAGVPITNYGVFLAYMNGIIDHVVW